MKKSFIMLFALLAISLSQNIQPLSAQIKLPSDSVIYRTVEQMPRFPGGMEALQKYFRENVHYPQSAIDSNIQGRVMVEFVVAQTGDITQVAVIKSVNSALDSEAVRVVSAMPKWEPAVQKGQKVNVYYKVPITFKLEEDTSKNINPNISNNTIVGKGAQAIDRLPQYPGGMHQLMKYLGEHIRYPKEAIKENIQGRVILEFMVNKDGTITDILPLRGLGGGCTAEAIRVLKMTSGKWIPGMNEGKLVNVKYKLPVTFRLQ